MGGKNLVIYYSRKGENYINGKVRRLVKGNTQICAEFIWKEMWQNTDIFEIETVKEYPEDYIKCTEEAKAELAAKARPELKKYVEDLADYDNVFVCSPNWWGTFPCAVFTQLERLDWNGKKVMALVTHEGGGIGSAEKDLKAVCKGASFGQSIAVLGSTAAEAEYQVRAWSKEQTQK